MVDSNVDGQAIDFTSVVMGSADYKAMHFGRTFHVDDMPDKRAYRVRIRVHWLAPVCENGVPGESGCYGKPEIVNSVDYLIPYSALMVSNAGKAAYIMARERADALLKETQLFIELGD